MNTERIILVTGANRGIGRAIVQAILEKTHDTFVYLGARDLNRGEAAITELKELNPAWADRISVLEVDVSSTRRLIAQPPLSDKKILRAQSTVSSTTLDGLPDSPLEP